MSAQIEQTDFWNEVERNGLIRMKREANGRGAADSVYRLAAAALVKFPGLGYNPNTQFHSRLIRQDDGTCLLEEARSGTVAPPVDGKKYIFVSMPDGSVRLSPATSKYGPAQVSGYAPYVRYAGEVIFRDGRETRATRQSGTYLPAPESARELSGLHCDFLEDFRALSEMDAGRAGPAQRKSP